VRRTTPLALTLLAALAQGCTSCDQVPDSAVTDCELTQVVPGAVMTDILFVIDDSGSMADEQTNLQNNLASFITALRDSPVANDFQVAVTTTSVSIWGANTATGEHGSFVAPVLAGDSPNLVADFQAQVLVGTAGFGKEQPLAAIELALSPALLAPGAANEGFLRPGARLAVVILTDEDDCSDGASPWADNNNKCHNDNGDGVDYKATVLDPVSHFVDVLQGPLGPAGAQETRDVVVAAIAGVDASTLLPTCYYDPGDPNQQNRWCCHSPQNDVCVANACGNNALSLPGGLAGDTYCCGEAAGAACTSSCPTAFDKADRLAAFVASFPSTRRLMASVCDTSFASTLQQIAGLIVSQTVPLEGAPADYRMLVVGVRHADGSRATCTVAEAGSPAAATAGAVYEPPGGASPARLTFQNGCTLDRGDKIEIDLICAG